MEVAIAETAPGGPAAPPAPRRPVIAAVALLGLVLATFGQTLGFGWVNLDDTINVTANPHLNPVTLEGLRRFWTAPYENLYAPLSYTLFAGETQASRICRGGDATAPPAAGLFHGVSVVLHAVNVLLVWRMLRGLSSDAIWPAAAGAAVFAVHPLQVESVAWISEQRGLLSATCGIGAMLLHLGRGQEACRGRRLQLRPLAAIGLFTLALLAKPQAVVVPLLLLLLETGARGRSLRTTAMELLPWFLLAGLMALLTRLVQPAGHTPYVAPWLRPLVAGDALVFYASTLVCPVHLAVDYGRTPQVVLHSPVACAAAVAAWLTLAGLAWAGWPGRWRLPVALAVGGLLPVLGFVPFVFQDFSTVADRYFYIAMLGPALAVTWGCVHVSERPSRRPARAAVAAAILLLAGGSFLQTRVWRDSFALWEHAIRADPNTFLGNCNLGAALIDAGRPGEAIGYLHRAVRVGPEHAPAHLSLGIALDKVDRLDEAARFYENVLLLHPKQAEAHNYLGVIHARQGRVGKAMEHFRAAVDSKPGYRDARANLDRALKMIGTAPTGHLRHVENVPPRGGRGSRPHAAR